MEAFVKARFDDGVGSCVVLITEGCDLVDKHLWKVRSPFEYKGIHVNPLNQFDLEILCMIWLMRWCKEKQVKVLNVYTNTSTCTKWYTRRDFPETRPFGRIYIEESEGIDVLAEYIPKNDQREFNVLMNELAVRLL